MTTANLSLGLQTGAALAQLLAFKATMKAEFGSVKFGIDASSLKADIAKGLGTTEHKLKIDGRHLSGQVSGALEKAFGQVYQVRFNRTALTDQIKAAVTAGTAGVSLNVGGGAPSAGGFDHAAMSQMKLVLTSLLGPAVDDLAKAAAALGSTARQMGALGGTGGALKASQRYSMQGEDGSRIGVARQLTGAEAHLTAAISAHKAAQAETLGMVNEMGFRAEQMRKLRAQHFGDALNELGQRAESLKQRRAQLAGEELNEVGQRSIQFRQRRAQETGDALNELGQRAESLKQRRAQAVNATRHISFTNPGARDELAQLEGRLKKLKEVKAYLEIGREDLAIQKLGTTAHSQVGNIHALQRRVDELRLSSKAATRDRTADLAADTVRARATFAARGDYTNTGARIAGVAALVNHEGEAAARARLGPDGHLIEQIRNQENYRKAVAGSAAAATRGASANKLWTSTANDAHSAARGLAGSLGMLWVTWGSTVPILAGAAIAASMRAVYEEGKRAEYQLAFIKGLSGSALSLKDVEASVAGSNFKPKDALDGLRALTQSGLSAREALSTLPEVLALATVGEISVGEAAFAATGVMKAFGLSINEVGRVSDVMAKSAAVSNASVQDMMAAFKYASAASSLYGVSLEETGASLAMLSEKNVKGTMAGTAHMNMLKEIYTPTAHASKAFKTLGLDMQEMQRSGMGSVEILDAIRAKTARLDSTGLREFSAAVGGERGNRELAPLLAGGTKKLVDMQAELERSRGFTRNVLLELQNTTEASSARMNQALTLAFSHAFESGRGQIQSFHDTLAGAFRSDGFKNTIGTMTNGVVNLTRMVIDHAEALKYMALTYASLKGVSILANAFASSAAAVGALSAAYDRNTLAARTAAAANTAAAAAGAAGAAGSAASASAALAGAGALSRVGVSAIGVAGAIGSVVTGLGVLAGVVGVGITLWELFRGKQDAAREAQDNYNNTIANTVRLLDQENYRLAKKLELQANPGKTEDQATILTRVKSLKDYIEYVESANSALKTNSRLKEIGVPMPDGTTKKMDYLGIAAEMGKLGKAREDLAALNKRMSENDALTAKVDAGSARENLTAWLKASKDTLEARRLAASVEKRGAIDGALKTLDSYGSDAALAGVLSQKQADGIKKALFDTVNAGGEKLNIPKPGPGTGAEHRDALAAIRFRKEMFDDMARLEDAEFAADEVRLKARHSAGLITDEGFAVRQEGLTLAHMNRMRAIVEDGRTEIEKALTPNIRGTWEEFRRQLEEGTKTGIDPKKIAQGALSANAATIGFTAADALTQVRDIQNAIDKVTQQGVKLDSTVDAARLRAEGHAKKLKQGYEADLFKAAEQQFEGLARMERRLKELNIGSNNGAGPGATEAMFGKDFLDGRATAMQREEESRQRFQDGIVQRQLKGAQKLGGQGAKDTALRDEMAAYDEAQPLVRKYAEEIERLNGALADQAQKLATLKSMRPDAKTGLELSAAEREMAGTNAELVLARAAKSSAEAGRDSNAKRIGRASTEMTEYQRTAEYGWASFWRNYTAAATDNAKLVDNVMSQSFSSMEQGLMKFVTTGKLNFKDFAASLIADAARMMANAALRQLLGMAGNYIMGAMGLPTVKGYSGDPGSANFMGPTMSANGNVMTPYGAVPLNKYAAGGVASSPQLSVFGEGRKPEAYVPLQDGRSIPVTMAGGGGGDTNVNVQVYVDGKGGSRVESDTSADRAGQLGDLIQAVVTSTLVKEKRPGGLLYPA